MARIKTPKIVHHHQYPYRPKGTTKHSFHNVYWPYLPVLFVASVLFVVSFTSGDLVHSIKQSKGEVLSYATSMNKYSLATDTNHQRTIRDLPTLTINNKLAKAAQAKADDMATKNYWSHSTPSGTQPWTFAVSQHYSYQKLGENLAAGFVDESAVVKGWLASSEHRDNLLDRSYTEVGYGVATSPNFTAAGKGPMTIVVALYGEPGQGTTSFVKSAHTSKRLSSAQSIFADIPGSQYATQAILIVLIGALTFWAGRHYHRVKKVYKRGEKFALTHPLIDIGLILIAALSYLLIQTTGFVG